MEPQRRFYEHGYAQNKSGIATTVGTSNSATRIDRACDLLPAQGDLLLDVGCGNGPLIERMIGRFNRVVGADIASAQLDQVAARVGIHRHNVELHRMNIDTEPIPLKAATADAVACVVLLEFVFDPINALAEIARVTKPGGVLVVTVGNIAAWKNRFRLLRGLEPRTTTFAGATNGGALHMFTQRSLCDAVERNGFSVDYVGCSGRMWKMRSTRPSLLGGDIVVRATRDILQDQP